MSMDTRWLNFVSFMFCKISKMLDLLLILWKKILNQWRLVTFQPGDAVQKTTFIFWNFILIFAFFLQISSNTALISLFFKFNIRFLKNIFWDLRLKWILLCVSEGRSQKLILASYDLLSIAFLVISDLLQMD